MKESRALTRARTFVGFLETWRYGVLLLVAVLTFGSLFLMRDLRFDNSDESFFTDDDPAVVAIERFRELFGNEDFVYVAVRNGGDIFDRDTLRKGRAPHQGGQVAGVGGIHPRSRGRGHCGSRPRRDP